MKLAEEERGFPDRRERGDVRYEKHNYRAFQSNLEIYVASVSLALLLQILLQECSLDSLLQFVLQGLLRHILLHASAAAFGADLFAVRIAHAWATSCIQTFHGVFLRQRLLQLLLQVFAPHLFPPEFVLHLPQVMRTISHLLLLLLL